MKIIIEGISGSGKTYFFLPEIIKLLKPKRVFKIKTGIDKQGYQPIEKSPHWNSVKWEYYNKDVSLNDDDLIFIDEPFYIENKEERKLINEHSNVIMCVYGYTELLNWIENLDSYLIINSVYIKPNSFPKNLFKCPLKDKKKELKQLLDNMQKGKVGIGKTKTIENELKERFPNAWYYEEEDNNK